MRLFLDDERSAYTDEWARAYTAGEAIAFLDEGGVVEVSLDHDLGPPEAGTGYDVMLYIEARAYAEPEWAVPKIRIHTANTVGRGKMEAAARAIAARRG